ncbi:TetR/AcrR family transcriptional regulator [Dasania sp. GY-MA-18]|uniref:TetR/AcrR family transcriptional regulator n=1 Tax=Dasania phycosphaerae TaxID=2950436 RepID=A0A9J6RMV2_9GAMM|nr:MULTISPECIES: TetR/AcrR family transcriptional regulator [Dasania]MCR8923088.1 TetR/AcrR family transcriptional regulator [Dasania sp. GY-MA-18]MCZ0865520.1 TetR/AcrR family transcriptional regulator [Dasania phycosphaerae]MCZ0869245.1 TetR/AcrR family transcriptional regulator [Dasania phycosphaerae]
MELSIEEDAKLSKVVVDEPAKQIKIRKQPSQPRGIKTVERILEATREILQSEGAEGFTMKKVAERLGMSKGSLYEYFPNKESIIYVIADQWLDAHKQNFLSNSPSERHYDNCMAWVEQVAAGTVKLYANQPGLPEVLNVLRTSPELHQHDLMHDKFVVEASAKGFKHFYPEADEVEVQALAQTLFTMTHYVLIDVYVRHVANGEQVMNNLKFAVSALLLRLVNR